MRLTFLGTGSMVPTLDRNTSGLVVSYRDQNILIDCGEGTQKQMRKMKISPAKINKLLITHCHWDHVFGLPGLLSTIEYSQRASPIEIIGPIGTKKYVKTLLSTFAHTDKIVIKVREIHEGVFYEDNWIKIEAKRVDHTIMCYAYSFTETDSRKIDMDYLKKFKLSSHPILKDLQKGKDILWNGKKISAKKATTIKKGKKLTVVFDTKFCKAAISLAKNSDLLVCEATLDSTLKDQAIKVKHLTSDDAAKIAKMSGSKKLIITHFSQRYKDVSELTKEAKKIFLNTVPANDFLQVLV